ncbi:MAG: hypothetical protein PVF54_05170 [Anaerolineae bacterium]|jgi:hypothetical protein
MRERLISGLTLSVLLAVVAGSVRASGLPSEEHARRASSAGVSAEWAARAPWFVFEVDTDHDTGQHVSVAVDPYGYYGGTYVSYYDVTYQDLRVAHFTASGGNCGPDDSWHCHTVDSGGDVGTYSSVAARAGGVNVSYHDATNGDLKWAESTDYPYHQTWRVRTVERGSIPAKTGLYTSLALPSYGSPRISYHYSDPSGDDALKMAAYSGAGGNCGQGEHAGKWRCKPVRAGEGVGEFTSLALDEDWIRYIAYYDRAADDLWVATNETGSNCGPGGNTWTCYPVSGSGSDVGKYASIYVDDASRFHMAYYDDTTNTLMYATEVGSGGNCGILGSAQCDAIEGMPEDYHAVGISMAEDAAGYPVIAYQGEYGSLKIARPLDALGMPPGAGNCGPEVGLFATWYCETVDPYVSKFSFSYRNGDYASIAVSPAGLATIAYYRVYTHVEPDDGNLVIARQRVQVYLPLVMRN